MFPYEWIYHRLAQRSVASARKTLLLDQPQSKLGYPKKEAVHVDGEFSLLGRTAYAQNDAYLEIVSPDSDNQWSIIFILGWILLCALFGVSFWYGMGVHPLLFDHLIIYGPSDIGNWDWGDIVFAWSLAFPFGACFSFVLYHMLWKMGGFTLFYHPLRGRIRFNRKTRKVYVLRPDDCGGNAVLDWDRMVANLNWLPYDPFFKRTNKAFRPGGTCLVLHHPADDPHDTSCKGEDTIFVGVNALAEMQTTYNWEYIRRYMEDGPGNNGIPKHIRHTSTTFCGMRSANQFCLETMEGISSYWIHMISQGTCWWPKFPKEWNSDSGLGEPEDRPVQTGAVMTALVYRAEGKLSKEDEALLMQAYGVDAPRP